jgi:hypothetical protein
MGEDFVVGMYGMYAMSGIADKARSTLRGSQLTYAIRLSSGMNALEIDRRFDFEVKPLSA